VKLLILADPGLEAVVARMEVRVEEVGTVAVGAGTLSNHGIECYGK